jgi:hypothetical protein
VQKISRVTHEVVGNAFAWLNSVSLLAVSLFQFNPSPGYIQCFLLVFALSYLLRPCNTPSCCIEGLIDEAVTW